MLIDDGQLRRGEEGPMGARRRAGALPVPPTIQALLGARVDSLPDDERALLTHVSVEGNVFHRDAMRELAPSALAPVVDRSLTSLIRRDVIRPDRSSFGDDEAFRFRHILIRDAAYRSLPKETRAQLHERFADWLERAAGERVHEFEEIAGYHLEQAYRFRGELGHAGSDRTALGARASRWLESAGRRALRRSDRAAAVSLLERSAALTSGRHGAPGGAPVRPRRRPDRGRPARRGRGHAGGGHRSGRGGGRRARRGEGARPPGVPAPPARRSRGERGCVRDRRAGRPGVQRVRGRAGPLHRAAAARMGQLDRGAAPRPPRSRGRSRPAMRTAAASSTNEWRSSAGSRRRCSSARRRPPRGSSAARRFAPRSRETWWPPRKCCSRSRACTRWRAVSTRRAGCSRRATPPSRSSACR